MPFRIEPLTHIEHDRLRNADDVVGIVISGPEVGWQVTRLLGHDA